MHTYNRRGASCSAYAVCTTDGRDSGKRLLLATSFNRSSAWHDRRKDGRRRRQGSAASSGRVLTARYLDHQSTENRLQTSKVRARSGS